MGKCNQFNPSIYSFLDAFIHWRVFRDSLYNSLVMFNEFNPSRPNPGRLEKIKLNVYFHATLWCQKRFYENLLRRHKEVRK